MILKNGNSSEIWSKKGWINNNRIFVYLLVLLSLMAVFCYSMGTVSADPSMIYVNNETGNDTWDGEAATWNGSSGPKLSIKNATGAVLDGGTVNLADGIYNGTNNRDITIAKNMVIQGTNRENTIIDAQNLGRIFVISMGNTVSIRNVAFLHGSAGSTVVDDGGAICCDGVLNVSDCNFSDNTASDSGGAIYSAVLNVTSCNFSGNTAGTGGAISSADLNVFGSNFSGNTARSLGGAIYSAVLNVTSCNFSGNTASNGGAIYSTGILNVTGCNFNGNSAYYGGAIRNTLFSYVNFNRFFGNYAYRGDDICGGVVSNINWWGNNDGPSSNSLYGTNRPTAWLVLNVMASPNVILPSGVSTVTVDITHDNHGNYYDPVYGHVPNVTGFNATFAVSPSDMGNFSPVIVPIVNGRAESTFTAGSNLGSGVVSATVDSEMVSKPIIVADSITDFIPPYPMANPSGGITNDNTIELSVTDNLDPEPDTYYTIDGSDPTTSSTRTRYIVPIILPDGVTTLKFYAVDDAGNPSIVYNETYTIDTAPPEVTSYPLNSGTYIDNSIVLSASDAIDPQPIIYYNTDGSVPDTSDTIYTGPIILPDGTTNMAFFAVDHAGNPSSYHYVTYRIDTTAPTASVSPSGGLYGSAQLVSLSINEPGQIYYTTNGNLPDTSATLYTGPINIDTSLVLKFIAIDQYGHTSTVYSESYIIGSMIYPLIYVNNVTGNDYWDGQCLVWNGTSGPKLSIKNAAANVREGGTVTLADGVYNGTNNRGITIAKNMTVQGQSITNTIIDAQSLTRIFKISTGCTVSIYNITFCNGNASSTVVDDGGAIYCDGVLNVTNCNFFGNIASDSGGAIYSAVLNVTSSNFSVNSANMGGAIATGDLNLFGCDFSGNTAIRGGAICVGNIISGMKNIISSNFSGNTASYSGGAIYSSGMLNVTGCNFYGNAADNGGSIYNSGVLYVNFNRFVGFPWIIANSKYICNMGGAVISNINWWGDNDGPSADSLYGLTRPNTWLVLNITVSPNVVYPSGVSLVSVDLVHDNHGNYYDPVYGHVPNVNGFNATFAVSPSDMGNFSPVIVPVVNGRAESTFTAGSNPGSVVVSAATDSETVTTSIDSVDDLSPPQPSANPPGGITNDNSIELSATDNLDPEPNIYYTTDGSDPTTSSTRYIGPIILPDGITTLKFFAVDDVGNPSEIYSETYNIDTVAPTVSANPSGGIYRASSFSISLVAVDNLDSNPMIYYTDDGSTPTTSSTKYAGPWIILPDGVTTLKFFAVDDAGNPSDVYTEIYTIDNIPPTVSATPIGGLYKNNSIVLSASDDLDPQPKIYYNTDGSTPDTSDTLYTGPIILPDGYFNDIAFFAVDNAGNPSSYHYETYTIDTTAPTVSASPTGGIYGSDILVDLTGNDNLGSYSIYYTTDGTTPTTSSNRYESSVWIFYGNVTLKFFAVDSVGNPSQVSTEIYKIDTEAPTVSANPSGGTYPNYLDVQLSASDDTDSEPEIYYTTNGEWPTTSSTPYNGPIHLSNGETTIMFFAVDNFGKNSYYYAENYIIDTHAPDLVFSNPGGGNYDSRVAVYLYAEDDLDPNPIIYYTTNGSDPTDNSIIYDGSPIQLHTVGENILKFFAVDGAGNPSTIHTSIYNIIDNAPPSVLYSTPNEYLVNHPISVELHAEDSVDPEPEIYYTTNGDDPTTSSTLYTGPISISSEGITTIKFIAVDDAGHISDICTRNYTIDTTPPTVTANPDGGTYNVNSIELLATDLSPISAIYYTTDGSDPTYSESDGYTGHLYEGPVIMGIGQTVLKFYAIDILGNPSQIYTENYDIIDNTPPTAYATPVGGTYYNNSVYVNLQAQDNFEGSAIYYTLNGTDPDTHSHFYNSPIRLLEGTTTLKFFAVDSSSNPSIIYNETYNLIDNAPPEVLANPTSCVFENWGFPEFPYYLNWVYLIATDMDPNPQIYYTLDGSNPTTSSTLYTDEIEIPLPKTILKFFAIDNKGQASPIHTEYYYADYYVYQHLDTNPPMVYANPQGGCYDNPKYVELVASDVDDPITAIYYTLDGSEPLRQVNNGDHLIWVGNGLTYTVPFLINRTTILKFAALNLAGTPSPVYMEIYMIGGNAPVDNTPPTVSASPTGGLYNSPTTVTITSSEPGHIYYTLNGDTPTPSSTEYTVPINIASTTTLKFFAIDRGGNPSPVYTENYTIDTIPPTVSVDVPTGVYNSVKIVNLSINEPGRIYYTTDGSTPTTSSNFYLAPIAITQSTILRFIGYDTAGNPSQAGMAAYIIDIPPADTTPPVVNSNPEGGLYNSTKVVTLTSSEPGHIYYTTDGSTPTTSSNEYNDPITIPTTTTIKFFAVDLAGNPSTVRTERYVLDTTAPTVIASPNGGIYTSVQFVNLVLNELGHIYYTTNGETPTASSTPFIAPLAISQTTVLKFIGIDNAGNPSQVYTETYNIPPVDTVPPTVTVSPGGGIYNSAQIVTLTSSEAGQIYYTTNGDEPTLSGRAYTDPIIISSTTTLKFFAVDYVGNPSLVQTEIYLMDNVPPMVTASPSSGLYNTTQVVILTSSEPGHIYYTTNGDTPTTSSTEYVGPINIASSTTLKFMAVDSVGNPSLVQTEVYVIDTTPPTATASPSGGIYGSAQLVSLSMNEPGQIYYTTNGTTPDTSATLYTAPINIVTTLVLKFIAIDQAGNPSSVYSESYTMAYPLVFVNNETGNDIWDGQNPTWNGTSGPKRTIKNAIGVLANGGILNIASGLYNGPSNREMVLDRNMTINGESQAGSILNAENSGRFFIINSDISVIIQNLTFRNGNAAVSGGAIYNYGNLTLKNCNFINNSQSLLTNAGGGAIVADHGILTVNNCYFLNNSAHESAGAIAGHYSVVTINDSTFTGNTALPGSGGAINNYHGTLIVNNSNFSGNTADQYAGAINNDAGAVILTNSIFVNNTVTSMYGGAISSGGSLNITNCTFINNTAGLDGGAIANGGSLNVTSSTFINNHANRNGGVITTNTATMNFCRFVDNTAPELGSTVVCYSGSVNAENNWWGSNSNPSSKISGTVDYDPWIVLRINASPSSINTYRNSSVTANLLYDSRILSDPTHPELYYHDPVNGYVPSESDFNAAFSVSPTDRGTFDPTSDPISYGQADTTFTASNVPGSITLYVTVDAQTVNTTITINLPSRNDIYVAETGNDTTGDGSQDHPYQSISTGINAANTNGRVHIANGTYIGTPNKGITITKNLSILGESQVSTVIDAQNSGRIFNINSAITISIQNLTLKNGNYSTAGGAIYNDRGNLTVIQCKFENNRAESGDTRGGAIYSRFGPLNVIDCIFSNNSAAHGGAINSNSETLNVSNSIFNYNSASYSGGAIDHNYAGSMTVTNSTFNGNAAVNGGGAIAYSYSGISSITYSTFTSNYACYGGAINFYNGALNVHFSRFYGNNVFANSGKAIYSGGAGNINAENNWWGTNSDPKSIAGLLIGGVIDVDPWIKLKITADPSIIPEGGTSTLNADLTYNSDDIQPTGGSVPDGITATFSCDPEGSITPLATRTTSNGKAVGTNIFVAGSVPDNACRVSVTVDQVTVSTDVQIGIAGVALSKSGIYYPSYDVISFFVNATNNGPDSATGLIIYDPIPVGTTYQKHYVWNGVKWVKNDPSYNSTTGIWNVTSLANGQTAILKINVIPVIHSAVITNIATRIEQNEYDTQPTTVDCTVNVPRADVVLDKSGTYYPSYDVISFFVNATNNGPDSATGLIIYDPIPVGTTYQKHYVWNGVKWVKNDPSYNSTTGIWNVTSLANGQTAILKINVIPVIHSAVITNIATRIEQNEYDTQPTTVSCTVNV